jgi:ABC-type phosphate transport system auxiliary subunit
MERAIHTQGAEMTLIERLKQTNQFHDNADVSTQEVVAAIQTLQAENERLKATIERNTEHYCAVVANKSALQAERDALAAKLATLEADAERLDWLDSQCEAYGFQDLHEGNRWTIDGPFANLRIAIDAAKGGQK